MVGQCECSLVRDSTLFSIANQINSKLIGEWCPSINSRTEPVEVRWATAGQNYFLNQERNMFASIHPDSVTSYTAPAGPPTIHGIYIFPLVEDKWAEFLTIGTAAYMDCGSRSLTYFMQCTNPFLHSSLLEVADIENAVSLQFQKRCAMVGSETSSLFSASSFSMHQKINSLLPH